MTETPSSNELQLRIDKALKYAPYAVFYSEHHKSWVIDQMIRALTGCPVSKHLIGTDSRGKSYTFDTQGESPDYLAFVRHTNEHGDPDYTWDPGTPP